MTPIETRKAQLKSYIEARNKATRGEWYDFKDGNGRMDWRNKREISFYSTAERPDTLKEFEDITLENSKFIAKAANESARIAEQLLECIEALEFYANKDNWLRDKNGWRHDMIIDDLDDETLTNWDGRFSGKRARTVINKISGEK